MNEWAFPASVLTDIEIKTGKTAGQMIMLNDAGTLTEAVRVSLQPEPETTGQVCGSGSDED